MASKDHDAQIKAVRRALEGAFPDMNKLITDLSRHTAPLVDASNIFSDRHYKFLTSVAEKARRATEFSLKTAVLEVEIPSLQLDYKSLFPDLLAIQKNLIKPALPSLALIQDIQREQFTDIIRRAQAAIRAALPPNWQNAGVDMPGDLEALLLDEGLALAWVPPAQIVAKLFGARTASERRRIIGTHWRGISQACLEELSRIDDSTLSGHVDFAQKAVRSLRAGHAESAQALSANLLDTILRSTFDGSSRNKITGQKHRLDIEDYPLRVAIVLGGIWGAHGEFWASKGDKIPREFSRHGSAHGVSRRQYSRVNSVIAIMHVVSLLRLLDSDLRKA